ncbi:MAG: hypothetical protein P8K08_26075 [Fuerstiella sp.]|nr:hypothetical protein [Fuerstiella sp.]
MFIRHRLNPCMKGAEIGFSTCYYATVGNTKHADFDSTFGAMEMKYSRFLILITGLAYLNSCSTASADEPTQHAVRSAVAKSLPYIAERGQWWMDKKKCVSCHRGAFTIWAHAAAAEAGIDVDQGQLTAWVDWSFEAMLKKNDKDVIVTTQNLNGVAQMLFATRTLALTETQTLQRNQLLPLLQAGQQGDGSWKPAGQLPSQKRPLPETTYITTAWNRWMGGAAGLSDAVSTKALTFLKSDRDVVSTESLVVQLVEDWDTAQTQLALHSILNEQNDDGGWGWIRERESDAMATGQVLYALSMRSREGEATKAIELARMYLLTTQTSDGSWEVKGTKKNKQDKIQETATYWGTCWAVIGLLESEKVR